MNKTVHRIREGDKIDIDISITDANKYLAAHPFLQLDSQLSDDAWVQLESTQQMISLIASTESICEGLWDGPGWYRTCHKRLHDDDWLCLKMGCPRSARSAVSRIALKEYNELDT